MYPGKPDRSNCLRARKSRRLKSAGSSLVRANARSSGRDRVGDFAKYFRTDRNRPPQERLQSVARRAQLQSRCAARRASAGRKTTPTPSGFVSAKIRPVWRSIHSRGTTTVTPTPSLDFPSAATAPRCSRRASAVSARSRMSCEGGARKLSDKANTAGIKVETGINQALAQVRGCRRRALLCDYQPGA